MHDPTCIYKTQDNVWMDKRVMLHWMDKVPAPYISVAPLGIIPIILLDLYHCLIMELVINVIQDLGCNVIHIPGCCTRLVQPLDIGYNEPFKTCIHAFWEEYMINDMHINESILTPLHLDVSVWISEAYWDLERSPIVKNARLKNIIVGLNLLFNLIINQIGQPHHSPLPPQSLPMPPPSSTPMGPFFSLPPSSL